MSHGAFLSLDGLDGTGKSTQCELLAGWLRRCGHRVVLCADPGGTELGMKLRELLLHGRALKMSPRTEALLFSASRAELVEQVIHPALVRGEIVISDRYLLANVVYHGYAGGLNPLDLWRIEEFGTNGTMPGLTVVLDLPVEQSMLRRGRAADRMENRGLDYAERVRSGFIAEAARSPETMRLVNASGDEQSVHAAVRACVQPWLESQGFQFRGD